MLKVRSGDLDKMALLFHRHHRPLYGFLYQMTRQREASEDMLQNVFYRMLRSRHTFTGDGDFKTWMFYIARNVIKDLVKKGSRDPGFYGAAYLRSKGRSLKKNCQALGICKPSTLVTSALEIF